MKENFKTLNYIIPYVRNFFSDKWSFYCYEEINIQNLNNLGTIAVSVCVSRWFCNIAVCPITGCESCV